MPERIRSTINERFSAEEQEAHEFRSHKRKDSKFLESFFRTIRSNPDIWADIEPVIQRRKDFSEKTVREGELHRVGAELFAGINLNPEAALLYDATLRDATIEQSEFLKSRIEQGIDYAPVVVIGGGGPHATTFAGALLHYSPETPAIGLEQTSKAGGIFGTTGDPAGFVQPWFQLNSRNRPEDRDVPGLPGTSGNINPLGTWAPLQVPDISGQQYPTQERLGRAVSHNNFNSMNLLVDAEVKKIRRNKNPGSRGVYEIEFEDQHRQKRFLLYTDIPVQATGLGRETFGIKSPSISTRKFLKKQQETFDEGIEMPRAFTFLQFLEMTTANQTLFPLEEFRNGVGLIGSGDSAKVIIEELAGVAGEAGKSTAQLDFVPEITVFGSFDQLRDDLLKNNRCRYARGFLEFQREDGRVFARVRSVQGKVVGFEETENGIAVFYKRSDNTIGFSEVPRIISAAGFKDETATIYELDPEEITDAQEIRARLNEVLQTPGSTLYVKANPNASFQQIARIEIGEQEERLAEEERGDTQPIPSRLRTVLSLTLIDRTGTVVQKEFFPDEQELNSAFIDQIERMVIPGKAPNFQPYIEPTFGDDIPAGERIAGENIYRIGAATKYPLPEALKALSPTLARVPENTAALAVKKISDERAARIVAQLITQQGDRAKKGLHTLRYEKKSVEFVSPDEAGGDGRKEIIIRAKKQEADRYLPSNIRAETVLRYELGARLSGIFPSNLSEINFLVERRENKDDTNTVEYHITFDSPLPSKGGWEAVDVLFENALVQRALGRMTSVYTTKRAVISVPFAEGKIDIGNISAHALDRKSIARKKKE